MNTFRAILSRMKISRCLRTIGKIGPIQREGLAPGMWIAE